MPGTRQTWEECDEAMVDAVVRGVLGGSPPRGWRSGRVDGDALRGGNDVRDVTGRGQEGPGRAERCEPGGREPAGEAGRRRLRPRAGHGRADGRGRQSLGISRRTESVEVSCGATIPGRQVTGIREG